jgi:hypothetical protein
MTPNVITQTSAKVAMASRFLGLVGSLSLDEQRLWFPNQVVQAKRHVRVNKQSCKQENRLILWDV